MSLIPSTTKVKAFAWGMLGFAVTAYAVTRLAPGLAAFVGLNPGGSAIPNASILTPPNVNQLLGRSTPAGNGGGQSMYSPFNPQGRNNIVDAILA
jgi:hypothetical protein